MQLGRFRTAVVNADLDQEIFRGFLGILDKDVKISILIEHAGVEQLVLEFVPAPTSACVDQVVVRVSGVRIFVEVLHVRMGRCAVEVEVILLDILAVITFAVGEAKEALLENRILAIPQGEGEAEPLMVIGDSGQAVLTPAISPRAGLVVSEIVPGIAPFAVVFANGAPLPFAQVWSPFAPWNRVLPRFLKPSMFGGHGRALSQLTFYCSARDVTIL